MNAICVCVEYEDLLAITLPRALRHFQRVLVVTSHADAATGGVVAANPPAEIFRTSAFTRGGAAFNKGAAIEEGLDQLGRRGWICLLDADIVLPEQIDWRLLRVGFLHVPWRRILEDPRGYSPELDWSGLPIRREKDFAGFCQIFNAGDPALGSPPWYPTDWVHAGGADSEFAALWPADRKTRLPWECLHLGPDYQNWYGRVTPHLDGSVSEQAERRQEAVRQMRRDRAAHGFAREKLPPGGAGE